MANKLEEIIYGLLTILIVIITYILIILNIIISIIIVINKYMLRFWRNKCMYIYESEIKPRMRKMILVKEGRVSREFEDVFIGIIVMMMGPFVILSILVDTIIKVIPNNFVKRI